MKTLFKFVAVPVAAAVMVLAAPNTGQAGNFERRGGNGRHDSGATAAAIVAGVAAVGIIAAIASQHDRDYPPAYCAPPPPPPPRYEPPRQWVPGHYELRRDQVCVPGYWDTVVERGGGGWAGHGWHGRRYEEARRVWVPEHVELREIQVWVPGHFELACAN